MTLLSTTTLTGLTTTISSISQDYTELHCYIYGVTSQNDGVLFCNPYNGANALDVRVLRVPQTATPISWINGTGARITSDADATIKLKRTNANNFWKVIFSNYTAASNLKSMDVTGGYVNDNTVFCAWMSGGIIEQSSSANIDSLQITISNGTAFDSGTIKIFGVK
jgi:hypothetical protein